MKTVAEVIGVSRSSENNIGSVRLWLKRRLGHLGHLERFRVPAAPIAVPKRSSVYPTVELTGRQPKRQ
jgi:hypothetical protein